MHCVAKALANPFPNVFPQSDNEAGRSHLHNLPIVWLAVKSGVDHQTAFAEYHLDVERHFHIGGVHVLVLQDDSIKFQKSRHGFNSLVDK